MTDKTPIKHRLSRPTAQPAPFIYYDLVVATGNLNGSIEIELGARVLLPEARDLNTIHAEIVPVGRLRGSIESARHLRATLDAAITKAEKASEPPAKAESEREPQAATAPSLLN